MKKQDRQEVYKAIDAERASQDILYPNHQHDVPGYLLLISHQLNKAIEAWYSDGNAGALHYIQNLAALTVCCMEEHGTVERPL